MFLLLVKPRTYEYLLIALLKNLPLYLIIGVKNIYAESLLISCFVDHFKVFVSHLSIFAFSLSRGSNGITVCMCLWTELLTS